MNKKDPFITQSIQKCEHCEFWTDGKKAFCSKCGEILDLKYRSERWELLKKSDNFSVFMKYVSFKKSSTNSFIWLLEKIIQGGQLILAIIVLLVTLILFFLPG